MSEMIDFSKINSPASTQYLQPGMYRLKIDKDSLKLEMPVGKSPYVNVRFYDEKNGSIVEKFFLTANSFSRIQYLHESLLNKRLDQKFPTFKEVGEYLVQALGLLADKSAVFPIVVGGKIAPNQKFYSGLPYDGFYVADQSQFEEGAFDKDSDQYKRVVTIQKPNPAVANTDAAVLPGMDDLAGDDSTPWGV